MWIFMIGINSSMTLWLFVVDRELVHYGQTHVEIIDKMKKEFKVGRYFNLDFIQTAFLNFTHFQKPIIWIFF